MIRRELLKLLPVAFIPSCTAPPVLPSAPPSPPRSQRSPDYGFTAVHLDAVVKLQAMSRSQRVRALRAMTPAPGPIVKYAISDGPSGSPDPVVLCRMLFVPRRGGAAFRAPMLGGPFYPGGTTSADWPLTPVALVDGAPFAVVSGYVLAGQAEPASSYLEFVLGNCDWTSFSYRRLSLTARMAACQSLLRSPVWRRPLADHEQTWFLEQAA